MAKSENGALIVLSSGFDYSLVEERVAKLASAVADRIRTKLKRTLAEAVAIGKELLSIRAELPHGALGGWLQAEFGWTDRTARNLMAVAEAFGDKSEIISDLAIAPTAAYLLAASSTPEKARQIAIEQAESGERITVAVAKEIVCQPAIRVKSTRSRLTGRSGTMGRFP